MRLPNLIVLGLFAAGALGCGEQKSGEAFQLDRPWSEIVAEARGQQVNLMMWQGDPYINRYFQDFVIPALRDSFGVTLNISGGQGSVIVSALMGEMEAGARASQYDLVWINGETFYQLRQIDALYGPFAESLPSARYVDYANPFIGIDFQQPIEGYEAPWGNVQMALIYDTTRVSQPPRTTAELEAWVKAHPGRFTFDNAFTGMTFLKALLMEFAGDRESLNGPFDEARYAEASAALWQYLNRIKAYFWKSGNTFPTSVAQMHQLFASGEIDFTMSNNDGEVDNKVLQGLFPETARAYVPDFGSVQNSHYLGIPARAPDKAGALVTINFLQSPAAQLRKLDPSVWGDGTILDIGRLPGAWPERFQNVPGRRFAPRREVIAPLALQEPAPEYMIRLYDDFRTHVIAR